MAQTHPNSFQSPWQGSLWDLTRIIVSIRRSHAFGRLTLRNSDRVGLAHLYFQGGRLAHIVGSSGDAEATLEDLQRWAHAIVRFDRGTVSASIIVTEKLEQGLENVLQHLQRMGLTARMTSQSRVVEGDLISRMHSEQLLTPQEWRLLAESTRRVSLAVSRLIGPREALTVLRDVLDDCSTAFPAFNSLHISVNGHLQITDTTQFDRMPRRELLDGFQALIATCQYFCAPIIGEVEAHKLIIQVLGEIGPALVTLGVFQINQRLLAPRWG